MTTDHPDGQHPAGNGQHPRAHWREHEDGHGLPLPGRDRWQPLRAGLVDLFLYDNEEFRFRDGHLLLRGNNGTGKSKVLALTLPFLLDGELAPHRVEPDADPAKRMEWNLLLGGRYQERLGYTWLEFGRLTVEGAPAYLTLGGGLKAAAGRTSLPAGSSSPASGPAPTSTWSARRARRWSASGSSRRSPSAAASTTPPRRTGEQSTRPSSIWAPTATTRS